MNEFGVNLADLFFSDSASQQHIASLHAKAVPPPQAKKICETMECLEKEAKKQLQDAQERQRQFNATIQTHGDDFMKLVRQINRLKMEEDALDD